MMTASSIPAVPKNAFSDMADDFDAAPLAVAVPVGRAALHPFEKAGLGTSPFRCAGVTTGDGNCAYCGHGLQYLFHVVDSKGAKFIVGSDCVEKTAAALSDFRPMKKNLDRQKAAAAKARKAMRDAALAMELLTAWKADNTELFAFLDRRRLEDSFCASLLEWLGKKGALTEGQQGAAERSMARQLTYEAERATKRQAQAVSAPTVQVDAIEQAFNRAREQGVKKPKMILAGLRFAPAPATGVNAGAIYVTDRSGDREDAYEGAYLGKIIGGKFLKVRDCTDAKASQIVTVLADPKQAAIAFGKEFGVCSVCAKELSDPVSIANGIGPICAKRFGW